MVQTRSQYEYVYRYIAFNFTFLIKIYFYFHETFGTKQGRSHEFVKGGGGQIFSGKLHRAGGYFTLVSGNHRSVMSIKWRSFWPTLPTFV